MGEKAVMGGGGPIPAPTALKLIKGERESRINRNEPVARDIPPECPGDVSPAVRAIWDYTVAELTAMHIACSADRDALMCYCEAVVTHRRASVLLAKSDVLIKGLHGTPIRNPALTVQRNSAQIIRAFAQEFGLTPSARTRIEVRGTDDGADDIFAGTG